MSELPIDLRRAIDIVKSRSREDRGFRALALGNSREALSQGGYRGADSSVRFTEAGGSIHGKSGETLIELEPLDTDASEEISDAELELVAGGGDGSGSGVTWNP